MNHVQGTSYKYINRKLFLVQFPAIVVKPDVTQNDHSNASTFCAELEFSNINDKSSKTFVQLGRSSTMNSTISDLMEKDVLSRQNYSPLPNGSSFYGKASDNVQNDVVSTTRKRPGIDMQPVKQLTHDFDPSLAEKRIRAMSSVSPTFIDTNNTWIIDFYDPKVKAIFLSLFLV